MASDNITNFNKYVYIRTQTIYATNVLDTNINA